MPSQTGSEPLRSYASPFDGPAVVELDGTPAVVLRSTQTGVEVWQNESFMIYPADTPTRLVHDLAAFASHLRLALVSLAALRRQALETLDRQVTRHATQLDEIRSYAVAAHEDGDVSEADLNRFLRTFGLSTYLPYVQVCYEIHGSYTTIQADPALATATATEFLRPDLSELTMLAEDTHDHTVFVTAAQPVQLPGGEPAVHLEFVIIGSYDTDTSDSDEAEFACQSHLRLDTAAVTGLVLQSCAMTIESVDAHLVD